MIEIKMVGWHLRLKGHGIFQAGVLEWAAIAFSAEQTACTQMLGSLLTTSMPLNTSGPW